MKAIHAKTLCFWGVSVVLAAFAGPAAAAVTHLSSQPAGPITTDGAKLYVGTGNSIVSVPIGGGAATTVYTSATPCCVVGLTRLGTNLFWIDPNGDPDATAIFRAPLSGGPITKIYSGFATGQPIVDGVGVTTDGVKLFTTDDVQGRVHSLNPDGSAITFLGSRYGGFFTGEHFNTLTESGGILYIADDGSQPSFSPPLVTSIPKTGGSFTTLHSGAPLVQPVAIAVGNGRIFVADHAANTIWQMPITGGAPTALVSGAPFVSLGSNGLLFFNNALYVADSSGIYRVDFGSPPAPTLSSISVTPSDPTINVGQTQQFTATGTFSDGSSRVLTSGNGTWSTKASMPTPTFTLGVGAVNDVVYAVGGEVVNDCTFVNTLAAYDAASNSWSTKAPMPTRRSRVGVGVVNGILYAVGGSVGCGPVTGTVEAYDPASNTWTTKASMPTPRTHHAVGVVNGILYAIGGLRCPAGNCGGETPRNTVEAYDPSTNTWTTKAPMPTPRYALAVGVANGLLFAVGGGNFGPPLTTVEVYDPVTDTWTARAPMPTGRIFIAGGVVNGILYVPGGGDSTGIVATVEAYDPLADAWTTAPPMPTARTDFGAAVVNGVLYAVGGFNPSGNLATNEAFTPGEATWSSSNTSVATINASGLATAANPGTTTIAATSGSISGGTTLTVVSPNRAPVANAGPDQTVEATGPSGASVTLDGSASSDPDGDALSYTWTGSFGAVSGVAPTLTFGLGTHSVSLAVHDGQVTATDSVLITVQDTIAPVLSLPASFTVEATSAAGATIHYAAAAADTVDQNPSVSCTAASGNTFPVGDTVVGCTATDASGNSATGGFTVTVVDTTPPVLSVPDPITVFATVPADGTVSYSASASDIVDPSPSLFCTPGSGITYPLGTTTVMCFSSDAAGNSSSASFTVTVIDSAAPVLNVPGDITVSATGPAGASVTYSVSATDGFDPDPELSCSPASGTTFPLGMTTVNCAATDDSGNGASAAFTVHVVYTFNGFFQPVENPPSLNVVKAGSAVPVKFSLSGDFGLNVFATGYPRSQTISCDVTTSVNGVEETIAAGASTLSYDASLDQYQYVWKTDKSWSGTCRQLVVKLADGTFHWANFMLR